MKIKICGICSLEDALEAVDLGADMLGYNFFPSSKRFLSPRICEKIQSGIINRGLSITAVAVFVDASLETVETILDDCGLDAAQLHGNEPPMMLEALGERAFKAIRPRTHGEIEALRAHFPDRATPPEFLIDTYHPDCYGGTGQIGDWELAKNLGKGHQFILAGGLHPGNIGKAVRCVRPWGVDVASGVEKEPGRKDPRKMQQFIDRARTEAAAA